MAPITLSITIDDGAVTKKFKFDSGLTVERAHEIVKDKVIVSSDADKYALFLRSADDNLSGVWLEARRTLDFYMLRDGDFLDYICKIRNLKVRMLDGSLKTMKVNQTKCVGDLMVDVCGRIGITNHDEYGLCYEEVQEQPVVAPTGTLTLKRNKQPRETDAAMKDLSTRLHTDDNVEWLDQKCTLRQLGVLPNATLLLKRRLFFSDCNVNTRDPVQLNLLYVQTRDAILTGRHLVTEPQAAKFAGIQCQIQFGDFQEEKHKPGFIENLEEYLPQNYCSSWGIERKILREFKQHQGLSHLEAKNTYIKTARDLPTFGVTFFLVKEKHKGKKKLVPRLLGINKNAILRLDEDTKEVLQEWPLTHVKSYYAGKNESFTLNFGDYSDKEYSVKTQDAHRIKEILEAYIDIIRKTIYGRPTADPGESSYVCDGIVQPGRAQSIQHMAQTATHVTTESLIGPNQFESFQQGSTVQQGTQITTVQQLVLSNQLNQTQQAVKGELPLRGDMSINCARKLNRLNSDSVKIVTLLTEPDADKIAEAQKIVEDMQKVLPDVKKGVKDTAEKQTSDESKKVLLDELDELVNLMHKLADFTGNEPVKTEDAKETAEKIADLTTQMYFSLNKDVKRRSNLLNRSRKSFMESEHTEKLLRKAKLIAGADKAACAVDAAAAALAQPYTGPVVGEDDKRRLERALEEKMGKLNAALALYMMAHTNPKDIDYQAAINSMGTIEELMPSLAKDAQAYSSCLDPGSRSQLLDEIQALLGAAKDICTSAKKTNDRDELQQAANKYSDMAGKLIFNFARGTNGDKEHEIIELAREAGNKTSHLLLTANTLTQQASSEPAASDVDAAGVSAAAAATYLLSCAQLTAPAIREPHCQSAMTAAAEAVSSSVHQLENSCKPLLEDPSRKPLEEELYTRAGDVNKALERLKDAYANLDEPIAVEEDIPSQEKKRLQFIYSLAGAKDKLRGLEDNWGLATTSNPSGAKQEEAKRRLEQMLAQLNAAIAALTAATADKDNIDFVTAEQATNTITTLLPNIIEEADVMSYGNPESRKAMLDHLRALCNETRAMCDAAEGQQGMNEAAAAFAASSNKLTFLISPAADRSKEDQIMDLTADVCGQAAAWLCSVQELKKHLEASNPEAAAKLDDLGVDTGIASQDLLSIAQVASPSIYEPEASRALILGAERLRQCAGTLMSSCHPHAAQDPKTQQQLRNSHRRLEDLINKLIEACPAPAVDSPEERKRLKFIIGAASTKNKIKDTMKDLDEPVLCQMMTEEDGVKTQREVCNRLAELYGAVAALQNATADGRTPDYAEADRAVQYINEMLPKVVEDARKLCGNTSTAEQEKLLQQLRELCDACQLMCAGADAQALNEGAKKFGATAKKLTFMISPAPNKTHEKQIIEAASNTKQKAAHLVSELNDAARSTDGGIASKLRDQSKKIGDAAKELMAVTQDPNRAHEVLPSAAVLRDLSRLPEHCQRLPLQQQDKLQHCLQQLEDALDGLVLTCNEGQNVAATEERKRLKFIMSASAAKSNLDQAQKSIDKPLTNQLLKKEDQAKLQHNVVERLALLGAEVATLEMVSKDGENLDYAKAERAVENIQKTIPLLIKDARQLSGNKDGPQRDQLLQQIRMLCGAAARLCDTVGEPQALQTAAADFNKTSKKLVFIISPNCDKNKELQISSLSSAITGQASGLASEMKDAAKRAAGPATKDLVAHADEIALAANKFRAMSQVLAPSVKSPECADALLKAVRELRTAATLPAACQSLAPADKEKLSDSQLQLLDSLNRLTMACSEDVKEPKDNIRLQKSSNEDKPRIQFANKLASAHSKLANVGDLLTQTVVVFYYLYVFVAEPKDNIRLQKSSNEDKPRIQFANKLASAHSKLANVGDLLTQPIEKEKLKSDDVKKLQTQLAERQSLLNAAIAALNAALADHKNRKYADADQAVSTIATTLHLVVQDARRLAACGKASKTLIPEVDVKCREVVDLISKMQDEMKAIEAGESLRTPAGGKEGMLQGNKTQLSPNVMSELTGKLHQRPTSPSKPTVLPKPGASEPKSSRTAQVSPVISFSPSNLRPAPKVKTPTSPVERPGFPKLKPVPPKRGEKTSLSSPTMESVAMDFLRQTRAEESEDAKARDAQAHKQKILEKFRETVDDCKHELIDARDSLKQLQPVKSAASLSGREGIAEEVCHREMGAELALSAAAKHVASLVGANYATQLDYEAATTPVVELTRAVKKVANDGSVVSNYLSEDSRKPFVSDLQALCDATLKICQAADSDHKKLNEAAITFGNQSAKVLKVVGSNVNPEMEKQVISRARAIGDCASRLASEAGHIASADPVSSGVSDVCSAGVNCVDAAGKLVYTAKLVAPTIGHATSQETLITSCDNLDTTLQAFSTTWKPLSATQDMQSLTQEVEKLLQLLEMLRSDVRGGKFGNQGRQKEVDVDTPLRRSTLAVIENAENMSKLPDLNQALKQKYSDYGDRLKNALQAVDVANARCQRAPNDKYKRDEMEMAIQELQMMLLQTRPSRSGQQRSDIVDFREFLQDLEKESEELQVTARKHRNAFCKADSGADDPITVLCGKITTDARAAVNAAHGEVINDVTLMTSEDDVSDIHQFGQDCDAMIKEINATVESVRDDNIKNALRAKVLPLHESCLLLRFAANCHISATKSAAYDEALRDLADFKNTVLKPLTDQNINNKNAIKKNRFKAPSSLGERRHFQAQKLSQSLRATPPQWTRALTRYALCTITTADDNSRPTIASHLNDVASKVHAHAQAQSHRAANWQQGGQELSIVADVSNTIYNSEGLIPKPVVQVLRNEDWERLINGERNKVDGTKMQLEQRIKQLCDKLSELNGAVLSGADVADSVSRCAGAATRLADLAHSLHDDKKPVQSRRISEAGEGVCLATYSLARSAERQLSGDPQARRQLMEPCRQLNEAIHTLERSVNPTSKNRLPLECAALQRSLQLQQCSAAAPLAPLGSLQYEQALEALQQQRDVLKKLQSDQAMSREQFLQSMRCLKSAAENSSDCSLHAAYLLSLNESNPEIGKQGLVDVPKLQKTVATIQDIGANIMVDLNTDQFEEEFPERKKELEHETEELLKDLDDAAEKTKDEDLKEVIKGIRKEVDSSVKKLYSVVKERRPKEIVMSYIVDLMGDLSDVNTVVKTPLLVPKGGNISEDTKIKCNELVKGSVNLLSSCEELIKEVTTTADSDVMTWVMFTKKKNVLDAFEALVKSVKVNGQAVNYIEGPTEEVVENEDKSYIQTQIAIAFKWLQKPMAKTEVKTKGQKAVREIIQVANKMLEDMKDDDPEKESLQHLVTETELMLNQCVNKYDQEQYSVLMDRVRELEKAITRGVVNRVVEDFMEAETPLADLDIIADAETDDKKRKFILEQKIAELLAQLNRVTRTARLLADTGAGKRTELKTCSEQTELLAPMLVKAAEERIQSPDNQAIIDRYKALLSQYAESLAKVRDLCDQAVDPMDFVQTASETMQRMHDDSTKDNDPMKCHKTSTAITKLANRVIQVGLSSSLAKSDDELQRVLKEAKQRLHAATPAPDTRQSRLPDWKDTTAVGLRTTDVVESMLDGGFMFAKPKDVHRQDQTGLADIYKGARDLHAEIREWSSRDNEIVAVAKRMAVLMARLSDYMHTDQQRHVLLTSQQIVAESHEVARLAKKLARECADIRIRNNLLQACERIPTISGQLKMLTTVKGMSLGHHGIKEDKEAMDMLVGNAQSLMSSISDVIKAAASASVKIQSQHGPRIKWVRKARDSDKMFMYM